MAIKKVRYPLILKENERVTDIRGLKEHFDPEKIINYFLDGKLVGWLVSRGYEPEATEIDQLDRSDENLLNKICEVFKIEKTFDSIDVKRVVNRYDRIYKLKMYTEDETIIENVDSVAFTQKEMLELYDRYAKRIYLCEGPFDIPETQQDVEYILVGTPSVTGYTEYDFDTYYDYKIPENIANNIGVSNGFVKSNRYVVFWEKSRWDSVTGFGISGLKVWNLKKHELKTLEINIPYEMHGIIDIFGIVGNKLVMRTGMWMGFMSIGNKYVLYDIEKMTIVHEFQDYRKAMTVGNKEVAYIDEVGSLVLFDCSSMEKKVISSMVSIYSEKEKSIAFRADKLFWSMRNKNDACIADIYAYDICSGEKEKIVSVKSKMSSDTILEFFYRDDSLFFIDISGNVRVVDLTGDEKKIECVYTGGSEEFEYVYNNRYLAIAYNTVGHHVHLFDFETREEKQIASGCGYTEKDGYSVNCHLNKFKIVGNYFYYQEGRENKQTYRINLSNGACLPETKW